MKKDKIEEQKQKLNLELRKLLALLDVIDGNSKVYTKYEKNKLDDSEFLDQQIQLIFEANQRLINIFKD